MVDRDCARLWSVSQTLIKAHALVATTSKGGCHAILGERDSESALVRKERGDYMMSTLETSLCSENGMY